MSTTDDSNLDKNSVEGEIGAIKANISTIKWRLEQMYRKDDVYKKDEIDKKLEQYSVNENNKKEIDSLKSKVSELKEYISKMEYVKNIESFLPFKNPGHDVEGIELVYTDQFGKKNYLKVRTHSLYK